MTSTAAFISFWLTVAARALSFVINPNFCQLFIFLYLRNDVGPGLALNALLFLFALPLVGYVAYVRGVLGRRNLYVLERNKRLTPFILNILSVLAFAWVVRSYYAESGSDLLTGFLLFLM